ncbi:hypothetical protein D3C72_2002190 [compost metagenome]
MFGLWCLEWRIGPEQFTVIAGANRKPVVVVFNMERTVPGVEAYRQGSVLQGDAVIAAKERQEQLALHQRIG